jgi:ketosteroid isomerase-like protein
VNVNWHSTIALCGKLPRKHPPSVAARLARVPGQVFVKRWQELFESYQGPIDYEIRDLRITAGDVVAFSHSLNRIGGTIKNGQKSDRWLRWTACYRKTNGKWLIVHEQVSVPVDVPNGKAVLDLKP